MYLKPQLTCFHIISGTAPPYLSELLHLYSPSPSLRSASDTRIFRVPREDSLGEILSEYRTCHLEISFFLCQACHVTLLFQVKTENPPLLFCLLIYHFLSSVSIKPMTTMLVFLRACARVCVYVFVCVCVCGGGCVCMCVCAF